MLGTVTREIRRMWPPRDDLAFDELVLTCALLVVAAAGGALLVAAVLTVAARLRSGCRHAHSVIGGLADGLAARLAPLLGRALLTGACGAAVLTAPPATAGPAVLPVPDRPVPPAAAVEAADGLEAADMTVRVRRGDTLWAIAARHLPAGAGDARVGRAWPVWFRHNRGPLGPDPHLIHPGTRVLVPPRFR